MRVGVDHELDALVEMRGSPRAGEAAERQAGEDRQCEAGHHCGASGTNFMRKHAAAFEPVPGPGASVVLRDVERLFVNAGIHAAGLGRVERDAPHRGARAGRRCATATSCRDLRRAPRRCPIRPRRCGSATPGSNAMSEILRPTPRFRALEGDAAIGRDEQSAALRGGEPVARVVRRLFDVQHLESGGAGEAPGFAAVFAAEDALFVAGHQKPGLARIHANGLRVFPVQARRTRRSRWRRRHGVTRMPAVWLK